MERMIYATSPHPQGKSLVPQMSGRTLTIPGGEGITLSEVLKIMKDNGVNLLNEVRFVGGHLKWQVEETAEEAAARAARVQKREDEDRRRRYDYYLKLKAEFESPSPEGEAW